MGVWVMPTIVLVGAVFGAEATVGSSEWAGEGTWVETERMVTFFAGGWNDPVQLEAAASIMSKKQSLISMLYRCIGMAGTEERNGDY